MPEISVRIATCVTTTLLMSLLLVNVVLPQTSLEIYFEPDNWTADMKRVKMTTMERGLKLRIDFTNLDKQNYITVPYLRIRIETTYEETDSKRYDYIELKNYAIPPNNTISTYYDVDLHRFGDSLGKWSVRLTYVTRENDYNFDNKIEPYPFEFKVASETELQKEIERNPSGFVFNPTIVIPISFSIPIVSIAFYFLLFRKKRRR